MESLGFGAIMLVFVWEIIYVVQGFFAYGTAYRFTKTKGDSGVSLVGWMIVFMLASLVPGLGIYFWVKYRHLGE
ncbi:MAG: hypothetical protein LBS21_09180 [Clostridiales bacterium]|jgi:hypothetical protein|nr:hypothetical protein [Clostridiales bacterium]